MAFHGRRSEIRDKAEGKHTHPGWDFMARGQRSETKLKRSKGTHILNEI